MLAYIKLKQKPVFTLDSSAWKTLDAAKLVVDVYANNDDVFASLIASGVAAGNSPPATQ